MKPITDPAVAGKHAMILRDWLRQAGVTQTALARQLGISQPTVGDWARAKHRIPPDRAAMLERITGGGIRRADLYPNLFE